MSAEQTFTAEQTAAATTAMRMALKLPPEQFGVDRFVGMISDEIEQLRATGMSDVEIAVIVTEAAGSPLGAEDIARQYAPPERRRSPAPAAREMESAFPMLAAYNAWANARLYAAAARLAVEQYRADRGAFFRSVHGTLNHLLVTDRIWMRRFTGTGEAPDRLDVILFEELDALRDARVEEDARIRAYVDGLDEAALAGTFSYRRVTTPDTYTQPLATALAHLFNHQTHHRGQAHCVLTGLVGEAPSLDLLAFQRETGSGMGRR